MAEFVAASGVMPRTTVEQRVAAIATCIRQAVDVPDLAELLEILGLAGSAEEIRAAMPHAAAPAEIERVAAADDEGWRTAALLADELELSLRLLGALVRAVRGQWSRRDIARQVESALAEVSTAHGYLASLRVPPWGRAPALRGG